MAQNFLGLDIGSHSIKGVRLAKSFRGLRLLDVFEAEVPKQENGEPTSGPLSAGQLDVLNNLILEGKINKSDLVALSLHGDLMSTREITLPFTDLKKIEQVAPFEVEAELPFDLETVTIDFMILDQARLNAPNPTDVIDSPQETTLLISAMPNTTLDDYLEQLQSIGIDPANIGINALSLFTFSKYFLVLEANPARETLIIDIGAEKTVLCNMLGPHLKWIRTLRFGSDLLTTALVETLGITWDAAEKIKSRIDLEMEDPTDEETILELETFEHALLPLVREIDKSIRILSPAKRAESDEGESRQQRYFHLCGKGGILKGLASHLSNTLEMEALTLSTEKGSLPSNINGLDTLRPETISQSYANAFGLALQESEGPPINFRQGEFAFGKENIARRHQAMSIGFIALFVLVLMGGDLYLHHQKKEVRYQSLKQTLRSNFREIFPNIRNIANEVEQTRAAIREREKTGKFLGMGKTSPLAILREITNAIPTQVTIDVFNLVIDGGTVRIQAQTDSFESVDRIRSSLLAYEDFTQVEVSDAKATASKKQVRFRIKMTVLEKEPRGKNRPS